MLSSYLAMNAWREILARTFDGFTAQDNVSPEWLINPATRRRLKLDRLYPEAGVAVRFAGLTAKGQGRQSDWDVLEAEQRDQTRQELCRINGVQLAVISPIDDPLKQLDNLLRVLSRASRVLAQSNRPDREKKRWMPALSAARTRLGDTRTLVAKNPEQMIANLAEAWRDREASLASSLAVHDATRPATPVKISVGSAGGFSPGQRVRHSYFGEGVIADMADSDGETTISILFDAAEQRTFLLSLVTDKLEPIA